MTPALQGFPGSLSVCEGVLLSSQPTRQPSTTQQYCTSSLQSMQHRTAQDVRSHDRIHQNPRVTRREGKYASVSFLGARQWSLRWRPVAHRRLSAAFANMGEAAALSTMGEAAARDSTAHGSQQSAPTTLNGRLLARASPRLFLCSAPAGRASTMRSLRTPGRLRARHLGSSACRRSPRTSQKGAAAATPALAPMPAS